MFVEVPALPTVEAVRQFATSVAGKPAHSKVVKRKWLVVVPQVNPCRRPIL